MKMQECSPPTDSLPTFQSHFQELPVNEAPDVAPDPPSDPPDQNASMASVEEFIPDVPEHLNSNLPTIQPQLKL